MESDSEALQRQLKVGQILVMGGKMKLPQVSRVLLAQRNGDTRQFGRIAVDLGYVTEQDVALRRRDARATGMRSSTRTFAR